MRKLLHRFELRLAVLAMVGLLIAQWGAMSHAYSHDAAAGPPVAHLAGASSHDPCNDCLAYAPLLSAGAAPSTVQFIAPRGRDAFERAIPKSPADRPPALAFRSRAPPSTL